MSTNDVPGHKKSNNDELAMGCWAEHDDGSLIFVESFEAARVIFSVFDISKDPPIEYRDSMPEGTFKTRFSWPDSLDKWTWHDKTPFPWNRIIKQGFPDGARLPSADHILTAAERVAESLRIYGAAISQDMGHRMEQTVRRRGGVGDKIAQAISALESIEDDIEIAPPPPPRARAKRKPASKRPSARK